MLASYLRLHPLLNHNEGGIFDIDYFVQPDWLEYWQINRRKMRDEFASQFGLRQAHDTNLKKQYDSDISQVTGG